MSDFLADILEAQNSLCHHGIKGQKWGVRRYQNPDGSLTEEGRKRVAIKSFRKSPDEIHKQVSTLNQKLNNFNYGAMVDGKVYTDMSKVPWNKYKTMTKEQMDKYKVGICWDFVNYQHEYFKENGIPHKSYMFVKQQSDDPNDIVTHTFNIVSNGDKQQWFESSWTKHQGVHDVKSYKDVVSELDKAYGNKTQPFDVYEYDPDGMMGIKNGEMFRRATVSDPIYQRA